MNLNKIILIGRMGAEPSSYSSSSGNFVTFSLATSEMWKNKDNTKNQKTQWHKVVVFNEKLSELIVQKCSKGSLLYVEGKLTYRDVTTKYTKELANVAEVIVDNFQGKILFLSSKDASDNSSNQFNNKIQSDWKLDENEILSDLNLNDEAPF